MFDEKAQLHTLEGVAASVILLVVIIYAIDATSLTPLTSSTSSVQVESELKSLGQDILNTQDYAETGYNSKLKNDIARWNGIVYIWNGSMYLEKGGTETLNNNLTEILRRTFVNRSIAYNVELTFIHNSTFNIDNINMIYNGDPSNNAIKVSRKIVFQNIGMNNESEGDGFNPDSPIKDIDPLTNFYNIVDIKLVLWRL